VIIVGISRLQSTGDILGKAAIRNTSTTRAFITGYFSLVLSLHLLVVELSWSNSALHHHLVGEATITTPYCKASKRNRSLVGHFVGRGGVCDVLYGEDLQIPRLATSNASLSAFSSFILALFGDEHHDHEHITSNTRLL
jgi:hypothetical protein